MLSHNCCRDTLRSHSNKHIINVNAKPANTELSQLSEHQNLGPIFETLKDFRKIFSKFVVRFHKSCVSQRDTTS